VRLSGAWRLGGEPSSAFLADCERQLSAQIRVVAFKASELISWDTSVIVFVVQLSGLCYRHGINMDRGGLPPGVRRLLALAEAVPEKKGARKEAAKATFLEHVGHTAIGAGDSLGEMLKFLGEMTVTFFRLLRMKVRFRGVDLFLLIQQCGAGAAHRYVDQLLGGRDSRLRRRRATETVRRSDLRGGPSRHRHSP